MMVNPQRKSGKVPSGGRFKPRTDGKAQKSVYITDSELRDLQNRIILECPRASEPVDTWLRRRAFANVAAVPFGSLPLSKRTLSALSAAEFKVLTKIQLLAIPAALSGRDILAESRTGSGKTLSFIIPMLEKLYMEKWSHEDGLGAVILSPTRELASQVFQVLQSVGSKHDFSAGLIVGGRDYQKEAESITGLNIVIATPGRLLQHLEETPGFSMENLKLLIIDEADRVLDLGFKDTVVGILEYISTDVQRLLYSATLRAAVKDLAVVALRDPEVIAVSKDEVVPQKLKQYVMLVELEEKVDRLYSFVKQHPKSKLMVFVSTCKEVRFLAEMLRRLKVEMTVLDLIGKQSIEKRLYTYENFKNKQGACVLVCTDVAARGLDIVDVDWVVQFDLPESASEYVHRIGRTARMDRTGNSLLMTSQAEWDGFIVELDTAKVPIPTLVNANKAKLLPSVRGKLAAMMARDKDFNDVAAKAFKVGVRALALNGRVEPESIRTKFKKFSESLGLGFVPDVQLPTQRKGAVLAKDGRKSKLEKLKAKIAEKKRAKAAIDDSDGWSEEMREDEAEKKKKKSEPKVKKLLPMAASMEVEGEEMILKKKDAMEVVADSERLETTAEMRAQEALKRKRVRIKKDGTMYVRGAGAYGRPQNHQVFLSEDEAVSQDEVEREAFIERTRRRLEERKEEMEHRERQRVKEKHKRVKDKLRGKRTEEDQEVEARLASDQEASDSEVDVAALEQAFKEKNRQ